MFVLRMMLDVLGTPVSAEYEFPHRPTLTEVEAAVWRTAEADGRAREALLSCSGDCRIERTEASVSPAGGSWAPLLAASQLSSGCCLRAALVSGIAAAQVAEAERLSAEQRRTADVRLRAAQAENEWLELRRRAVQAREGHSAALERSKRCEEQLRWLRGRELDHLNELQQQLAQRPAAAAAQAAPGDGPSSWSPGSGPGSGPGTAAVGRAVISPLRRRGPPDSPPRPAAPPRPPPPEPYSAPRRGQRATVEHVIRLRDPQQPAGLSFRMCSDGSVAVSGIIPGGPADLAGLCTGAVVRSINGVPVLTLHDVRNARCGVYRPDAEGSPSFTIEVDAPSLEQVEAELAAQRVQEEERRIARRRRELEASPHARPAVDMVDGRPVCRDPGAEAPAAASPAAGAGAEGAGGPAKGAKKGGGSASPRQEKGKAEEKGKRQDKSGKGDKSKPVERADSVVR